MCPPSGGCSDPSVINPDVVCPAVYDPVCGCDGQTYPNACTAYFQNGITNWTPGECPPQPCSAPTGLSLTAAGHTYLDLAWNDSDPPGSWYVVQWRQVGTPAWVFDTLSQMPAPDCFCQPCIVPQVAQPPAPEFHPRGLKPCTPYEFRVKKICFDGQGNAGDSNWTSGQIFNTQECGNSYFSASCFSVAKKPQFATIGEFHLLDLHDTTSLCNPCTGCDNTDLGYRFLANQTVVLQKNQVYAFSLAIASGTEFIKNGYVRIWIDFNHDLDFNDAGEMVYSTGQASTGVLAGKFFVSAGAATGITRMRVTFHVGELPGPCSIFDFGKVNDYLVDIQPAACTGSLTLTGKNVSCAGGSNGSIVAGTNGGNPPFSYAWSTGSIANSIAGLAPGTYTLTLTNGLGCTATSSFTVLQPPALFAQVFNSAAAPDCASTAGSVQLHVAGGTPGYQFNWSNGATTEDLLNVPPAFYAVTVTDTLGCTATQNANVALQGCHAAGSTNVPVIIPASGTPTVSSTLQVTLPPNAVITDVNVTGINIEHIKIGDLVVKLTSPPGATVTLVSQLCNSPGFSDMNLDFDDEAVNSYALIPCPPTNFGTFKPLMPLSAFDGQNPNGTWTLVIMDMNHLNGGVLSGWGLSICYSASTPTLEVNGSIPCNATGIATVEVSGGVPDYSFLWSNGAISQTIIGLSAGDYAVTATDQEGCKAFGGIMLTPPQPPIIVANVSPSACSAANGAVMLSINGGTAPFFFNWSNGATSQNIFNLAAGTYSVILTDANGCTATQSATVTATNSLDIAVSSSTPTCHSAANGSASVTVLAGNGGYTYKWSNGSTTQTIGNLTAGTYFVTVTDVSGCSATASTSLTQPPPYLLDADVVDSDCQSATGSINLTIAGGTPPYSFLWNNGATTEDIFNLAPGTYSVTATDANGCINIQFTEVGQADAPVATIGNIQPAKCFGSNTGSATAIATGGEVPYTYLWSHGVATSVASALLPGTYSVTVTDANQCTATANVVITQPQPLVVNANADNTGCSGATGLVSTAVTGGTPPFTYLWSTGATSPGIGNLAAGTYTVTVTDSQGCSATGTASVAVGSPVTLGQAQADVSCHGGTDGSAIVYVQSGNGGYTYQWSNGATTQNIGNLTAGTYTVTVTDALMCTAVASVQVSQPAAISVVVAFVQNVSCFGKNDGYVNLNVSGGTGSYTFKWSISSTQEDLFNIPAGTYSVTVCDGNGCSEVAAATVGQPAPLVPVLTATDVSCHGAADGKLTLSIAGGTPPYGTGWSPPVPPNLMNLPPGTYSVTISDVNGCVQTTSATIGEPPPISVMYDIDYNCNNPAVVTAVLLQGGTQPYSYQWSNGNIGQTAFLPPGTFGLTVEDAKGCITTSTVTIPLSSSPGVALQAGDAKCFGSADGSLAATPSGGTPPYTFAWSNGTTGNPASALSAGNYTVTVSDAHNCSATATGTVAQPPLLGASVATSGGTATAAANGGTPPYSFTWSNSTTGNPAVFTQTGNFSVTVTDGNNCTATATFEVLTGTVEASGLFRFEVSPNPASSELTVRLSSTAPEEATLCLTDVHGRTLEELPVLINGTTEKVSLDVATLPAGMYFVTVKTTVGWATKRVVKL
jgi:subtilisin-like proprotein convertase family protein